MNWSDIPKGLCPLGVEAAKALGLDFGAVDIIEKNGRYYVLEVNTAPRLEGYSIERYSNYFKWFIDTEDTKHFDVKKYMWRF